MSDVSLEDYEGTQIEKGFKKAWTKEAWEASAAKRRKGEIKKLPPNTTPLGIHKVTEALRRNQIDFKFDKEKGELTVGGKRLYTYDASLKTWIKAINPKLAGKVSGDKAP